MKVFYLFIIISVKFLSQLTDEMSIFKRTLHEIHFLLQDCFVILYSQLKGKLPGQWVLHR